MKIAGILFSSLVNLGGLQVFTFNLLSEMSHLGHDCTLYITDKDYKSIKSKKITPPFKIKSMPIETIRLAYHAPFLLQQVIKLFQFKERYDIWQGMGAYPAASILFPLANHIPVVLRAFGEDIQRSKKLNYGYTLDSRKKERLKKALQSIHRVIAMTNGLGDSFYALDVPPTKVINIPNTVNVSRFNRKINRKLIREQLGISENTTLFITVGRYHIKKGHDLIPEIADSLRGKHVNFKWLLIGNGLDKLKNEIEYRDLSNYIILKDEIGIQDAFNKNGESKIPNDDLIDLLKCADIFVFPTRLEGFPMVIIEAMAAGIPIVTTNSPGTKEVVTHNTTALLSEIDDVESMISNIAGLINNNDLREKLVQNAKKELPKYDLNNVAEQYLSLYTQLVEEFR